MSNIGNKEIMALNIKRFLDKKGMTMKDLAVELNVPYTTVLDWCKGATYPRIDKIELMARFFGVVKSELVEDPNDVEADKQRVKELQEQLRDNPAIGMLLSAAKDLSEDDINALADMAKRLRATYKD